MLRSISHTQAHCLVRLSARYLMIVLTLLILPNTLISATTGLHFKHTFEKGDIKCDWEYTITGTFPITIKRTYQDGKTEILILDKPHLSQAEKLYKLVKASKDHLITYMPMIVKQFGESVARTKTSIQQINSNQNRKLYVLTSFEEKPVVGAALQGYNHYKPGSVDGMYWAGSPSIILLKGPASATIHALVDYGIATKGIKYINYVIEKSNKKSIKLAESQGLKKIDPNTYDIWDYPKDPSEVYVFSITAEEWKAKYWPPEYCQTTSTAP